MQSKTKRLVTRGLAVLALGLGPLGGAGPALAAGAGGVTGPAIYVDGDLYRTVGTPTDFSHTGAPEHSYDILYNFGAAQPISVAAVAPGDPGYNGGRWMVHGVTFPDYAAAVAAVDANDSGDLDSAEEVEAALAAGLATDTGVVKMFECPVIPLSQGQQG